ncbi:methyltransferase [Acrasis kona]|uniref:Methyltransferase n=1 Tax=Acrasis kona TaxID=1008807 RepID=A0AAW2ZIV0_9EUKA
MPPKKRKLEAEPVNNENDMVDSEDETPKKTIKVKEMLKNKKVDPLSIINNYAESDDDSEKRGFVLTSELNKSVYNGKNGEKDLEEEEDVAAMRARIKKKMRERRAKDIKRQKRKREKSREVKSGTFETEVAKEAVITSAPKEQPKTTAKASKSDAAPRPSINDNVKVFKTPAYKRKHYTVSIAVPGSILNKIRSDEVRTKLCGEIARCATIFKVDEIVVYNEAGTQVDVTNFLPNIKQKPQADAKPEQTQGEDQAQSYDPLYNDKGEFVGDDEGEIYKEKYANEDAKKLQLDDNVYMANILYFLETPPYLRAKLFTKTLHCLKDAINLPPLNAPHHLQAREFPHRYRDGVVLEEGNLAFIGHQKLSMLQTPLPAGLRVTLENYKEDKDIFHGKLVSSQDPKNKQGIYWGYSVRIANSLSAAISECPHSTGYDVVVAAAQEGGRSVDDDDYELPYFKHLMIVFGLEEDGVANTIQNDNSFPFGTDVRDIFDQYINTCPHGGSRLIRTEENIMITLSSLRKRLDNNLPPVTPNQSKFSKLKLRL